MKVLTEDEESWRGERELNVRRQQKRRLVRPALWLLPITVARPARGLDYM